MVLQMSLERLEVEFKTSGRLHIVQSDLSDLPKLD